MGIKVPLSGVTLQSSHRDFASCSGARDGPDSGDRELFL